MSVRMDVPQSSPPALYEPFIYAIRSLRPAPATMIDLGAGKGVYGYFFYHHMIPWDKRYIIGYDLYPLWEFFEKCYDEFHILDFTSVKNLPIKKVVDPLYVLIETIEHIETEKGEELLRTIGKTGHPLILSTPVTFHRANPNQKKIDKKGWEHVSYWDFNKIMKILGPFYKNYRYSIIWDRVYCRGSSFFIFEQEQPNMIKRKIGEV